MGRVYEVSFLIPQSRCTADHVIAEELYRKLTFSFPGICQFRSQWNTYLFIHLYIVRTGLPARSTMWRAMSTARVAWRGLLKAIYGGADAATGTCKVGSGARERVLMCASCACASPLGVG